jgi:hypothetical protein
LAVLAIGIGGFWGYTLLSKHFLEREVTVAIENSEKLLERLATERELDAHRQRVERATGHLNSARNLYAQSDLLAARDEAERSLALLSSVDDALRHRSPAGEAQIIATKGKVEVRRGERGEWQQARSRTALFVGDYVKTSANATAEGMMVDGTMFTVRPSTVLLITRKRSAFGLRSERTLSLESGWVNLSTAQTKSRITTPEAEATVDERSEAVVAYNTQDGTGSFASHRGALKVAAQDGTIRNVGELQKVVQTNGGLSEVRALPEAPLLAAPMDNFDLTLEASDTVELSWQPVKGAASYALQVSQSRLFVDNVIDIENRIKTAATLGLRGEGSFVWRVAAYDDDGEKGPWSTIHRFRVATAAADRQEGTNQTLNQGG